VSAALAGHLTQLDLEVVTGHYRPGLLWARSPTPTTEPHAKPSRPSTAAAAKIFAVYADFVLGYAGPWKVRGRDDRFVILERGWWDHVVDPIRYRLPDPAMFAIRLLGRTLPKADLVVILSGDADRIVARKPELESVEIHRQLKSWRGVAPAAGHQAVEIDTVASSVDEVIEQLVSRLELSEATASNTAAPVRWREVLGAPSRVGLRATEGAAGAAALAIYQPMSSAARLASRASTALVQRRRGRVTTPPVPDLAGLWTAAGFGQIDGMASMTSSTAGRAIVGAVVDEQLVAVAKVGQSGDKPLVNEGEVLRELAASTTTGFVVPDLKFAGSWNGRPAVVATAMGQSAGNLSVDDALSVAIGLANIDGRFLTHGDLAPWNLRRQRGQLVLVDFEHAVWKARPLADLAHYLVQTGALLGERSADETWAQLCGPAQLGCRYLAAIGHDGDPAQLVADYVERQLASGRATTEEEQNYLRHLGALPARSA